MNSTLLKIFTELHYLGELIAIGKRQGRVHTTVDSILFKMGRVEITISICFILTVIYRNAVSIKKS